MAKGAKNWRYMIAYRSNEGNIWDYFFAVSPKKLGVPKHPVQSVHPVYPVHPVHPLFNCILRKESNGTELSLGSHYLGFCIWQPCISRNL